MTDEDKQAKIEEIRSNFLKMTQPIVDQCASQLLPLCDTGEMIEVTARAVVDKRSDGR